MLLQVLQGGVIQALLHGIEKRGKSGLQLIQRDGRLFAVVTADGNADIVLDVAGTELEPQGNALHLILGALPAEAVVREIGLCADAGGLNPPEQLLRLFGDTRLMGGDRDQNDLDGGNLRGENQAVVVAVGHDHRPDHTGRGTPGGLEGVLKLVVAPGKGDVIGAGELVAEVMGGSALQGLVVLHHAFHRVGGLGTGELFLIRLAAAHHRNRKDLFKEIGIGVQLLLRFLLRLLGSLVDGVAFLPPELTGTQERTGGLFPADDRAPLVIEHGELAVGVQNPGPVVTEHGLGGGTEGKALFQRFAAAHGNPGNLGRKAVDQFAFLFQKALGNQHGHGHVDMAGGLKGGVQGLLHVLPEGIAVGAQNGKTLDRGILDQLGFAADVGIPLGEIGLHIGNLFYFFLFSHKYSPFFRAAAGRESSTL